MGMPGWAAGVPRAGGVSISSRVRRKARRPALGDIASTVATYRARACRADQSNTDSSRCARALNTRDGTRSWVSLS
jgi:hypothetical protein